MNLLYFTLLVISAYASAEHKTFDNYSLYRILPKDVKELNVLRQLEQTESNKYDFWSHPRAVEIPVDIMVSPENKNNFYKTISEHNIDFEVVMEDVQKQIDEENLLNTRNRKGLGFSFNAYHTLSEIQEWLRKLAEDNPTVVKLVIGGKSYEGRDILGVKISFRRGNEKRAVWLDSLIHAREWISGATTVYILNEILTSSDPTIRRVAESHDWYFFPVINPDGYQFTHTTDRMWRKTRTPYGGSCYGSDPNRNWDYQWNNGGSTNNPCDETYAGPYAFSELETKSLSEYMSTVANDLLLFITFHSYSQLMLLPYGHTTAHLDNYNITYPAGLKAANSLAKRYGTKYTVGNIAETIYIASGSNMDWLKGTYHVPFAYAVELRDTGRYGFLLPPNQIIPTGEETLDAIVTLLDEADKIIN